MRWIWRGFLIAVVVALVAAGVFAARHWEPDRGVDELAERWAAPPSQFIAVGEMSVHVRIEGPDNEKTPIVLLHGTSSSLHTWDGWTETLRQHRRVIRFDLPGFGLTGPHPDGDYHVATYADFVADTMDALGIERAVIAGNSLGGRIAWMTAARHREKVAGLVLVDASAYAVESTSVPIGFRLAGMPVLKHAMANVLPRHFVRASIENVYGDPSLVTPELVDRYFELTVREGNRRALRQRFEQLEPGAHVELIPTIQQPTLILWGGRDRLIPRSVGDRLNEEIESSRMVVFDQLGHVPQEEDPAVTIKPVMDFFLRFENDVKDMDLTELTAFATRYAAAWSGREPTVFASFYAENGKFRINDGEQSLGRDAIEETARSFMTAFPDMVVRLVEIRKTKDHVEFHWHWTGTNTGPGGTGNAVDLKGYEQWTLDEDGLILETQGHMDDAEYQRQLNAGATASPIE